MIDHANAVCRIVNREINRDHLAAAKLQEMLPGRPITYRGQNLISLSLLAVILSSAIYLFATQASTP